MTSKFDETTPLPPTFEWTKHTGLVIGLAASALICLKLLAVAGWDSNTAFGILAANGTANVLTGTLLAVLPTLYGAFAFTVAPRIERSLRRRTPVERAAAQLLATWPTILLVFIVPVGLLLAFLSIMIIVVLLRLVEFAKARRGRPRTRKAVTASHEAPSRFEATSAGLAGLAVLLFGSLSIPWMPSETVVTSSGREAAFVLSVDGEVATVLLNDDRTLAHLGSSDVTGAYCQLSLGWWNSPIPRLFADEKYPPCPRVSQKAE